MIRGTTPTHTFTLPFGVETVAKVRILYAQHDEVLVTKTEEDCTMTGQTIQVRLTQEETLALDSSTVVAIQLRVLTTGGEALASDIMRVLPGDCLENEVMA